MALGAMVPTSGSADNLINESWYLVYTKARQESAAAHGLQDQGDAIYLPKLKQRRRMRGRLADVIGALQAFSDVSAKSG